MYSVILELLPFEIRSVFFLFQFRHFAAQSGKFPEVRQVFRELHLALDLRYSFFYGLYFPLKPLYFAFTASFLCFSGFLYRSLFLCGQSILRLKNRAVL